MSLIDTIVYLLLLIIGLSLGSFCNNLISFYIKNSKFDLWRSVCACGKRKLSFLEIIPIWSYFFYNRKCKICNNKLSSRYFIIEILIAFIPFLYFDGYLFDYEFILKSLFSIVLLVIGIIDLYTYIIPNKLLIILFFIILLSHFYVSNIDIIKIISAIIVVIVLLALNYIIKYYKNIDSLGYGDIKLLFLLFLFFFPISAWLGLWLSSLIGLISLLFVKNKKKQNIKIPFGFYISIIYLFILYFENSFYLYIY